MSRLERFHSLLKKQLPSFEIGYKDQSWLMKVIGFILFFNKKFMTNFTTTLGQKVYFPSKEAVKERELSYLITLAHEYVHAKDGKKFTNVLFGFLYLVPLSLAPFMWLFLLIHWGLALGLFLLLLAPLPAAFRSYFELRGYQMSLFVHNEILKEKNVTLDVRRVILESYIEKYNKHFVGANYYFMWPFGMKGKLRDAVEKVLSEVMIEEDKLFLQVRNALNESKN